MRIIVTLDILAEYIDGLEIVREILDNPQKKNVLFYTLKSVTSDYYQKIYSLSEGIRKQKMAIFTNLLKQLILFSPSQFDGDIDSIRKFINDENLIRYTILYIHFDADYIWVSEKTKNTDAKAQEFTKPIKFIQTPKLLEVLTSDKPMGVFLNANIMGNQSNQNAAAQETFNQEIPLIKKDSGSSTPKPQSKTEVKTEGKTEPKTEPKNESIAGTYRFLDVDVPIANVPPNFGIYTQDKKKSTRFANYIDIPDMEFSYEHATEYLKNIGIYSYRQKRALFYDDLFFKDWKDVLYIEVEHFEPEIDPYVTIYQYSISKDIEHLCNLFFDSEGQFSELFEEPIVLQFIMGSVKKENQVYLTTEQKLKKLGTTTDLPFTYEAILLDKDEFHLDTDAFKREAEKQKVSGGEYKSLEDFCEKVFDNLVTPKSLLDGQRFLRFIKDKIVDLLEVGQYAGNLTFNYLK